MSDGQMGLDIGGGPEECLHRSKAICAFRKANGDKDVIEYCHDCGWRSPALPHSTLWKLKLKMRDLEVVRDNRLEDPCEVCGSTRGLEFHHWAPTTHCDRFEAHHKWPTSWLCRRCHQEWHRIVTPDIAAQAVTLVQLGARKGTTIREIMDAARDKLTPQKNRRAI